MNLFVIFLTCLPPKLNQKLKYINHHLQLFWRDDELCRELLSAILINQRLIWRFKQLLNFWLYRKISKKTDRNMTDPITLDLIKSPIELYDLNARKLYLFESKTITRYLHSQITSEVYEIKNPYTQCVFKYRDLVGLYFKIKTTWAIETFYECGFSINIWKIMAKRFRDLKELRNNIISKNDYFQEDFLSFMGIYMERIGLIYRNSIVEILEYVMKNKNLKLSEHQFIQQLVDLYRLLNESQIVGNYIEPTILNTLNSFLKRNMVLEFLNYVSSICKDTRLDIYRGILN